MFNFKFFAMAYNSNKSNVDNPHYAEKKLRFTTEQDHISLEKLKKVLGETVETKAIMRAITMLPGLIDENATLKKRLDTAERSISNANRTISDFVNAFENLCNFKG